MEQQLHDQLARLESAARERSDVNYERSDANYLPVQEAPLYDPTELSNNVPSWVRPSMIEMQTARRNHDNNT